MADNASCIHRSSVSLVCLKSPSLSNVLDQQLHRLTTACAHNPSEKRVASTAPASSENSRNRRLSRHGPKHSRSDAHLPSQHCGPRVKTCCPTDSLTISLSRRNTLSVQCSAKPFLFTDLRSVCCDQGRAVSFCSTAAMTTVRHGYTMANRRIPAKASPHSRVTLTVRIFVVYESK